MIIQIHLSRSVYTNVYCLKSLLGHTNEHLLVVPLGSQAPGWLSFIVQPLSVTCMGVYVCVLKHCN